MVLKDISEPLLSSLKPALGRTCSYVIINVLMFHAI